MAYSGRNHRPEPNDRPRAVLLRFFLGSIALNAAFGVWALVVGDFGQTEGKILVTSLLISAATLSVLVNSTPIQHRSLWPVPGVAAFSAASAFVLLIVFVWTEIDDEAPLKTVGTMLVIGAAGTLAGLLQLVALPRYEWMRLANNGLISLLAVTVIWGIWVEPGGSWYARTVGVESVLVAATTLSIPILWRFGREGPVIVPADGQLAGRGGEQLVESLATHRVVSVEPTETLRAVVDKLADEGVDMVAVRDSNGVAGLVSEHDVVLAIRDGADLDASRAVDVMSTSLVVVSDQTTTVEAARQMSEQGVRYLLVHGDDSGIVSARDLLSAVSTADRRPRN